MEDIRKFLSEKESSRREFLGLDERATAPSSKARGIFLTFLMSSSVFAGTAAITRSEDAEHRYLNIEADEDFTYSASLSGLKNDYKQTVNDQSGDYSFKLDHKGEYKLAVEGEEGYSLNTKVDVDEDEETVSIP